jgi:hypothetical protein
MKKNGELNREDYEPRYQVSCVFLLRALTRLSHAAVGEFKTVQISPPKREHFGRDVGDGEKQAEKPTEMRVPAFRTHPAVLKGGTVVHVPIMNMKRQIRGSAVGEFVTITGLKFGEFIRRVLETGIFSIPDTAKEIKARLEKMGDAADAELKRRVAATAKKLEDADNYVKNHAKDWRETQRRLGLLFPCTDPYPILAGLPAKGAFAGDIFTWGTAEEAEDIEPIRGAIEYAKQFDPTFEEKVRWIPAESMLFIDIGTVRGPDGQQGLKGEEFAAPGTTWVTMFNTALEKPLTRLALDTFILGLKRYARDPMIGGKKGKVACDKLVLRVLDLKAADGNGEEVYLGSWAGYPGTGLTLRKLHGSLGLDLEKNNGERVAAHIAISLPYLGKIAELELDKGGLETIAEQVDKWYNRCVLNGGKD